ncbi:hypothetical protein, partial [Sulfuricurvum sp.]|uniref:hypothetical protein n=1 Tax=Sulfuricurvum sp. TaxID=2025608 RepID=UPI002D6AEB5C
TPPPAVGGYAKRVDLIHNIFNLHSFQIPADAVIDIIDRAIGRYEINYKPALIRVINPFYYLGMLFDVIIELPFIALGKVGFNREKAESSVLGKIVKGTLYLITVIAAFLTILQLLDFLDPFKLFIHELLGARNSN